MVSLAEQRRGAEHLETKHEVSERRACRARVAASVARQAASKKRDWFVAFMNSHDGIRASAIARSLRVFAAKASRWVENDFV
jgi:hypothetical protein